VAIEVQRFAVTIPAGTLQSAPQKTALAMPPRTVERIEITVPPGPRGVVGFQLAMSGAQVLPITPGAFVVTDDEHISWDLTDQNTSGAWQMIAYNTGTFPHTIEIRFLTSLPLDPSAAGPLNPLPASALSG
jgi:hypothetical protein